MDKLKTSKEKKSESFSVVAHKRNGQGVVISMFYDDFVSIIKKSTNGELFN